MSYGRDRDAHHHGVGAIAAADHMRVRRTARRARARATANRDRQLAGLTYGVNGGLSGYGTFEQLGTFNTFGTPMQSGRDPGVRGGGGIDTPPPRPPPGGVNRPGVTMTPPRQLGPGIGVPPVVVPPLVGRPTRPAIGVRPSGPTVFPGPIRTALPVFPTRPGPGGWTGGSSSDGSSTGGSGSGGSSTGGSGSGGGGDDGAGGGIVTGGSSTPTFTPPQDVPDAPPISSDITIAGVTVPKTAALVGGLLAAWLLFGRKR